MADEKYPKHVGNEPHLSEGRKLARASRRRTPGWPEGSEQDNLQRRMLGSTAARVLTSDTMKHNKKKKKKKKDASFRRKPDADTPK